MKNPAIKLRSWFFLVIVSAVPTMGQANSVTVTVCAHAEGDTEWKMSAKLRVLRSGAVIPIMPQPLVNNCVRVKLPACDDAVMIEVNVPRSYAGRSTCSTDPTPMLIAMQPNRAEILTAAFAGALGDGFPGFDRQAFISEIDRIEAVMPRLPEKGRRAVGALYAALATENYSAAQLQATEVAGFLRSINEERLSLAYSSITYVAGFRAIGVDALASENPLVSVGPGSSSLILNDEGRNILELYQSARGIPSAPGVWDLATTSSVATVGPLPTEFGDSTSARGAVAPKALRTDKFTIDSGGRFLLLP